MRFEKSKVLDLFRMPRIIRPQPGPQTEFVRSTADIKLYLGEAGSGKSAALIFDSGFRAMIYRDFRASLFRRTMKQVTRAGGLWDTAQELYAGTGGSCVNYRWTWPGKGRVEFDHLQLERTKDDYQGTQIPYVGFDELTHFLESQWWYLWSRNRSSTGFRACMAASANADASSWVKPLVLPWLDCNGQFMEPSRSGKLLYFVRMDDGFHQSWNRDDLVHVFKDVKGEWIDPTSMTAIRAVLADNKLGDPTYARKLAGLPPVERKRLLEGDWAAMPVAGDYFKRSDFKIVPAIPTDKITHIWRHWDLAATEPSAENHNPDWTVGVKIARFASGRWCVLDVVRGRWRGDKVREVIKATAIADGVPCAISIPEDTGAAGKTIALEYTKFLAGYKVTTIKETGSKVQRAVPFAAQCAAGNVDLLEGKWNADFIAELELFPTGIRNEVGVERYRSQVKDDQVDAAANAFNQTVAGSAFLSYY
jgi:predicted phage terminase large subunit-like protein